MNKIILRKEFSWFLIAIFILMLNTPVMAGTDGSNESLYPEKGSDSYESQDNIVVCNEDLGSECLVSVPVALTEVEGLNFDPVLLNSTPYWIYIAAGKKEQQDLIYYIANSSVSADKKGAWIDFLQDVWKKYLLRYSINGSDSTISCFNSPNGYSLAKQEEETFEEIDNLILSGMQEFTNEQVKTECSGNLYSGIMDAALQTEEYINNRSLKDICINSTPIPDYWYSEDSSGVFEHCINHGYTPSSGTGCAPQNTGIYACLAKTEYEQHNYEESFRNLGYSSHFMIDLGQPFKTPGPGQELLWPYYDNLYSSDPVILRYQNLNDAYEIFLWNYWNQDLPGGASFEDCAASTTDSVEIFDPVLSAVNHSYVSSSLNSRLYYLCQWHFIVNHNSDFEDNPLITEMSMQRVAATTENVRGLIRYVTGEKGLVYIINPSAGENGAILLSKNVSVVSGGWKTFYITPDPGYVIDEILVDNVPVTQSPYTFTNVLKDHTISATFLPVIVPLCPAGTPFDDTRYPQNQTTSDPMALEFYWDGEGSVFISGSPSELTGVWVADRLTITFQPHGRTFFTRPYAPNYFILDLTPWIRTGTNQLTLTVNRGWRSSMSYGASTRDGTNQTPYIIQVNSAL